MRTGSLVTDPDRACVYVVVVEEEKEEFNKLHHWQGDGRNHILINLKVFANQVKSIINNNIIL